MKINPTTMLFEDLETQDIINLRLEVNEIVFNGKVNWESPYLKQWLATSHDESKQKLILASMVYPTRVLLSVLEYFDKNRLT